MKGQCPLKMVSSRDAQWHKIKRPLEGIIGSWLALQMEEDGSGGGEEMKANEYRRGCQQDFRPASALQMQRKAKTCLKIVPRKEPFSSTLIV